MAGLDEAAADSQTQGDRRRRSSSSSLEKAGAMRRQSSSTLTATTAAVHHGRRSSGMNAEDELTAESTAASERLMRLEPSGDSSDATDSSAEDMWVVDSGGEIGEGDGIKSSSRERERELREKREYTCKSHKMKN